MKYVLFAAAIALAVPATVSAQSAAMNRFSIEPYAGAMKDVWDIGNDNNQIGYFAGAKLGFNLGARARLVANLGYGNTDDVAFSTNAANREIWDNRWVHTLAGAEFDVVPGRTSVALGLQGGALWRKAERDGFLGNPAAPTLGDDDWTAYSVVVPSLSFRHQLGERVGLSLTAADYFHFENKEHSAAVSFGVTLR